MHQIRILTEVTYPDGPNYAKWDYFLIEDEQLPDAWKTFEPEEFYDFLNEGGFWNKGWQEITDEVQHWLDTHDDQCGLQSEVAKEVAFV